MKLFIYGTETDKNDIEKMLSAVPDFCYRDIKISAFTDYDNFIAALSESEADCIAVTADGATGMEGVIAAKNLCRSVPVLWFSDDGGFGAQSYRLGCAYFHKKPISPKILSAAIAKCV